MHEESMGALNLKVSRPERVEHILSIIKEANELLQKEGDLSPANQRVVSIIARLTLELRSHFSPEDMQEVLSSNYIRLHQLGLRAKLSEAEFLAELSDSIRVCGSDQLSITTLTGLSCWPAYMALVRDELLALRRFAGGRERTGKTPIVFVGSGPMPLSPIILNLLGEESVVCLEIDNRAYEASQLLMMRLGMESKVKIVLCDGADFDYSPYEGMIIASLVPNKEAVLSCIRGTSPYALVGIRTAEGLRQIMYEALDESRIREQGWRILDRTSPDRRLVINSTLLLEPETTPEYM
ncbi:nicotianamine synthase family protein [Paenibacillus sp. PL2-23]|uniref:nicotianamine synthase family protein n=1 Tax=Paenibacillus sp. PL2-23 TaxID=2100729 RepID=UPI0030F53311